MSRTTIALLLSAGLLAAQNPPAPQDPWAALRFLEGTWDAMVPDKGSTGYYTFARELGGHILARHSDTASCAVTAICDHGDLLYIYQDAPGQPLKGIYFDNEGHVIHYGVSTPAPASVILTSDPAAPGPAFRLVYELKGGVMSGKFQTRMPGKPEWMSYLEWSGSRK